MQVVLVYLEWFWHNSLLKCVLQPKIAKKSLKTHFLGSKSFKFINVGTTGKLVGSACYSHHAALANFYWTQAKNIGHHMKI